MSCKDCLSVQKSTGYDIANVKERFIPTYYHTQIFSKRENICSQVRFTPTFRSNVLDVGGYQQAEKGNGSQSKKYKSEGICVYRNESRQKKIKMLNSGAQCNESNRENLWYDETKKYLFDSLKCPTERYSRSRKLADLTSSQVFGGGSVQFRPCILPDCTQAQLFVKRENKRETVCDLVIQNKQNLNKQEKQKGGEAKQRIYLSKKRDEINKNNIKENLKGMSVIKGKDVNIKQKFTNCKSKSVKEAKITQQNISYQLNKVTNFGQRCNSVGKKLNKITIIHPQHYKTVENNRKER